MHSGVGNRGLLSKYYVYIQQHLYRNTKIMKHKLEQQTLGNRRKPETETETETERRKQQHSISLWPDKSVVVMYKLYNDDRTE